MLALNSGHTVGNVAAPDLVGLRYCKLTVQMIRDIRSFNGSLFVSMRAWLLTDQCQLTYQSSNFEATNDNSFLAEQAFNCPAAGKAAALGEQTVYPSPQGQVFHIHTVPPLAVLVIAGTADFKRFTDQFK